MNSEPQATATRVMIVDDHEVVRLGIRSVLEQAPDLQVVAEAGSADEALRAAARVTPRVVLMDVRMPGGDGIQACKRLRAAYPDLRVLMLTSHSDREAVVASILAGASGFLLKNTGAAQLVQAIRSVARGESLLDPAITADILDRLRRLEAARGADNEPDAMSSETDNLTGVLTRSGIRHILVRLLEDNQQRTDGAALVQIDIDSLRHINGRFGQPAGDALLRAIGTALAREAGLGSAVGRVGGDEFLVLLRGVDSKSAFARASVLVRAVYTTRVETSGSQVNATCTAGVVLVPSGSSKVSTDELLAQSDEALAQAKKLGRNAAHLLTERQSYRESLNALDDVRRMILNALSADRVHLVRMPIVSVMNRSVAHYEVLVRITDERGQIRPPADFITQAEALDLIQQIDRRVMEQTMRKWRAYADRGTSLNLSVNLSARSISEDAVNFIHDAARTENVPPSSITIEITETAVARDEGGAETFAARLLEHGFRIAIDDFGSGTTSLKQVRKLRFHYLKLDGSLVRHLSTSEADREFVRALVKLVHQLGIQVVAEFVSDEATMEFLRECGVEYAQGYYLGKPEDFPDPPRRT